MGGVCSSHTLLRAAAVRRRSRCDTCLRAGAKFLSDWALSAQAQLAARRWQCPAGRAERLRSATPGGAPGVGVRPRYRASWCTAAVAPVARTPWCRRRREAALRRAPRSRRAWACRAAPPRRPAAPGQLPGPWLTCGQGARSVAGAGRGGSDARVLCLPPQYATKPTRLPPPRVWTRGSIGRTTRRGPAEGPRRRPPRGLQRHARSSAGRPPRPAPAGPDGGNE